MQRHKYKEYVNSADDDDELLKVMIDAIATKEQEGSSGQVETRKKVIIQQTSHFVQE